MTLLTIRNVKKQFGDLTVLENINMDIAGGERIGLVGMNGAGKTTLAELIFGSAQPDGGALTYHAAGLRIGYLRQSTSYSVHAFSGLMKSEQSEGDQRRFLEVSSRLGLRGVKEWEESRFAGLSGGERTKLAIAHIWASKPDILLLDEPTNHLDYQGVDWLIGELRSFGGTTIIISHDRYFLDEAVDRIVELQDGSSVDYPGNYTYYREEKARRYASQLRHYEERHKYERKIEAEINRLKNWSDKAHRDSIKTAATKGGMKEFYRSKAKSMDKQIKSRIHRLEKIDVEGVKKPKEEAKVAFGWDHPGKRGRRIVEASRIGKRYGARQLFRDSSFYVQRGEKVGLIGPNGAGKTTLLEMLMHRQAADDGVLWISPTARIAYLTQDVSDLREDQSALELLQLTFELRDDIGKARTLLANMGFDEPMLGKPIRQLSLGERTRIKLAQLILQEQDVLILDEPTNHLDLASREQLEQTLESYAGTLIIVSHDRYLIEKLCDKLLVIEDGTVRRWENGFRDYALKQAADNDDDDREVVHKDGDEDDGGANRPRPQENAANAEGSKAGKREQKRQREEELLLVTTRIAYLIGELSLVKPTDARYAAIDEELKGEIAKKKTLN
ncbi:ribosomal protection-like ABC-F family protein [Paenibacillus sacheonensis]|uniref:ABC-F type ribosomal protection protein n=1 Tax=Paenibacillus sacheonensis TaxID=742054 RepID=A0A7X4YKY5_9BACL|nr:ABC-F type ribosomal protection protein [Paenibacillus sacheonensis]NBC68218.1 ABC-F type ribosomal protection protein [Paenibacillus sacheonensis]